MAPWKLLLKACRRSQSLAGSSSFRLLWVPLFTSACCPACRPLLSMPLLPLPCRRTSTELCTRRIEGAMPPRQCLLLLPRIMSSSIVCRRLRGEPMPSESSVFCARATSAADV
jgi:hypothetical protein